MFRAFILLILIVCSLKSSSQLTDTLSYAEQLAALEAEMDSLSIFNLIESVMALEVQSSSELNLHAGFTSSVTSAGRDYDINQQGVAPGVSYYHKSGIYADLSGYWNSDFEPNYNPTVFSLGYLTTLNEKWSYSLDYERWIFNPKDTSDNPLQNSIGASLNYEFVVDIGLDYSILFGNETAHRLIGTLGKSIDLGKWWLFDDIRLYPNANILLGNSKITRQLISQQQLSEQWSRVYQQLIDFTTLSEFERDVVSRTIETAFENGRITERRRNILLQLLETAQNLTQRDIEDLQNVLDFGFTNATFEEDNAFGVLNYAFSIPLALSSKNLTLLISYSYSIPVSLPGEFFEVDPVGIFGASISYRIPFK